MRYELGNSPSNLTGKVMLNLVLTVLKRWRFYEKSHKLTYMVSGSLQIPLNPKINQLNLSKFEAIFCEFQVNFKESYFSDRLQIPIEYLPVSPLRLRVL